MQKDSRFTLGQLRVKNDIVKCRTIELGGHLDRCDHCGHERPSYNSCRNRHCPKCQALSQAMWIGKRKERILPTKYFHVVFTLPAELRPLAYYNPLLIYDLLFTQAAKTLQKLCMDKKRIGGLPGITIVLHTWTRELIYHPHVHCIVTGGGFDVESNRWHSVKGDYLLPRFAMAKLFRGKFLDGLNRAYHENRICLEGSLKKLKNPDVFFKLKDKLYQKKWVVYAKTTLGGPEQVFEYLGRYTHRVAISNQRLISICDKEVTFYTKNNKSASLSPKTFIKRFLTHVLPRKFVKIRHYGLNAGANVNSKLILAKQLLANDAAAAQALSPKRAVTWVEMFLELTGIDITICPKCHCGRMQRGPLPENINKNYEDTS